ncbi:hypothetical protein E0485_04245 [Paenibacillus albiflavus]|uniref:Anti-sigma factor n=1 Tax=Paenibacillus albiflavus TaxID=2545760 RepID=A0A4R4EIS8_9BACL|nr:anti-sigma factor [Paenibacillus albiflavus]TCZ80074.1 hypothetical protein E0485_04245 [Paenibacillus albiflavus]
MSEDFKNKLNRYTEGQMSDEEKLAMEQELEKLEIYQQYIDTQLGGEQQQTSSSSNKKESAIIRKGKWKARLHSAMTVISLLIIFSVFSGIVTTVFYQWGDRSEIYAEVVKSAISVTQPNVRVNGVGINSGIFYRMNLHGEIVKQIGNSNLTIGQYSQSFLFGLPGLFEATYYNEKKTSNIVPFQMPNTSNNKNSGDWSILEKLPEGTVSEVYLSLDQLYTTDELLSKLEPVNDITPLWFAADVGALEREGGYIDESIGFPYFPQWLSNEWTLLESTTTKTGLFTSMTSSSRQSPTLQAYGSGDIRDQHFMNTLRLLQQYKRIANNVSHSDLRNIDDNIQYLEKNGVKLYGVVVTGPTKEILKLKDLQWISVMRMGEARLWNISN